MSTTHTITGAIVGVGASRRLSAVRWGVAGRVVWAWVLTIPGAWLVAMAMYAVVAASSSNPLDTSSLVAFLVLDVRIPVRRTFYGADLPFFFVVGEWLLWLGRWLAYCLSDL